MTNTSDITTQLRSLADALAMGEWIALKEICASAADEIERLREERDEARREVCELLYNRQGGWPKEHATERGWDCFREGT